MYQNFNKEATAISVVGIHPKGTPRPVLKVYLYVVHYSGAHPREMLEKWQTYPSIWDELSKL